METITDESSLRGKTVLVTGAGGFIGSHLTERLVGLGASVRAMVRYNSNGSWGWLEDSALKNDIEVYAGDICDPESVRNAVAGREIVFHLAALIAIPYSYLAPRSYVRTNVEGTLNVLQACRDEGVTRLIHTSTSEVYGSACRVPITEDHPLQGQSPYSASKIGADKIAESYYLSFNTPVVTVRPFNTFGPRQSARAVIPTIITQLLAGKGVRLGSLTPTRDLNFVSNTVDGFIKAAEAQGAFGKAINIGSGREISIGDLVTVIANLMGVDAQVSVEQDRLRPGKSEVQRLLASNELALQALNWNPKVSLEEGLEETIAWIRDHQHLYRTDSYAV